MNCSDVRVGQPLADGSWPRTLGCRTMRMSARCQAGRAWADLEEAQLALTSLPYCAGKRKVIICVAVADERA